MRPNHNLPIQITIRELDQTNIEDANRCDGTFTVDGKLVLYAEGDVIRYTISKIPPYQKRYDLDEFDLKSYISNPERVIYIAYWEQQVAGQIRLRRNWNGYAYVEDIVVDRNYRRRCVGLAILAIAEAWAKAKQLPGVMLETQNNNLAGCRLYESYGFKLLGFDNGLYRGINPNTDEIALYWYLMI